MIEIQTQALEQVACFMSKEDVRRHLNGVFLEFGEGESRLVATDGHVLAVKRFVSDTQAGQSFIIPADTVMRIIKAGSTSFEFESLRIESPDPDREGVTVVKNPLGCRISCPGITFDFQAIEGQFPDYRRVIPKKTDGVASQFNLTLLNQFAKARRIYNRKVDSGFVCIEHNGDSPALVSIGDPNFVGVIMPARITPDSHDWLTELKLVKKAA